MIKNLHTMKSKILSFLSIAAVGLIITTTMNSNSGGVMGKSVSGCGGSGCHGNSANTGTTITLTGIPSLGYTINQSYTCTLTVNNPTGVSAGFDMSFGAGTITSAPSGTMNMGNELHHTTPKTMSGGKAEWIFTWKAPANQGGVTFGIAANSTNGNGNANGDEWNKVTFTFPGNFPASVNDVENLGIKVYPNPTNGILTIEKNGKNVKLNGIYSISGQKMSTLSTLTQNNVMIDMSSLSIGQYLVAMEIDGKSYTKQILKQ